MKKKPTGRFSKMLDKLMEYLREQKKYRPVDDPYCVELLPRPSQQDVVFLLNGEIVDPRELLWSSKKWTLEARTELMARIVGPHFVIQLEEPGMG